MSSKANRAHGMTAVPAASWPLLVEQLREVIRDSQVSVVSRCKEVRDFRQNGKALLQQLRCVCEQLAACNARDAASAQLNADIVEVEFLGALGRVAPDSFGSEARIRELCSRVLTRDDLPDDVRLQLHVAGLGAAIDDPASRTDWTDSAEKILQKHSVPTPGVSALAYNYIVAQMQAGNREAALGVVGLLDTSLPDVRLMTPGLYAPEANKLPCLYLLAAYLRDSELVVAAEQLENALSELFGSAQPEGRSVICLALGYDGIYALVWPGATGVSPEYVHLVPWKQAEALRIACDALPWAHFLNRGQNRGKQGEFSRDQFAVLQELWEKVLEPVLKACKGQTKGVDIIPIGWLALIPWAACGADPESGSVAGTDTSFAIVPRITSLRLMVGSSAPPTQCGRFFVRGDWDGIEAECQAEEDALLEMGFEAVEARKDIFAALRSGLIVHFSGHGRFRGPYEDGDVGGFYLRDGTRLTYSDLVSCRWEASPRLVSFSSCQLGFCYLSEGTLAGFPGLFLDRGSVACVAPLWKINAQVATDYFAAFYRAITSGSTVGEAARAAFTRRGEGGKGTRNLGLWSPMVVYGNQWQAIIQDAGAVLQ